MFTAILGFCFEHIGDELWIAIGQCGAGAKALTLLSVPSQVDEPTLKPIMRDERPEDENEEPEPDEDKED